MPVSAVNATFDCSCYVVPSPLRISWSSPLYHDLPALSQLTCKTLPLAEHLFQSEVDLSLASLFAPLLLTGFCWRVAI